MLAILHYFPFKCHQVFGHMVQLFCRADCFCLILLLLLTIKKQNYEVVNRLVNLLIQC